MLCITVYAMQEPKKKPFSIQEVEEPMPKHLLNRDRETLGGGVILIHTNTYPRRKEIAEVSVIDKSGKTVAFLSGTVRALSAGTDLVPLVLKVEDDYDWDGATGAKCKVRINGTAGVTRNDHWSFDYKIELISSDLNTLTCSASKINLYSAPNKKRESSVSGECILKPTD